MTTASPRRLPPWRHAWTRLDALGQQIADAWQTIEPLLRAWVAEAETLTEQEWMDEPECTRAFYDTWKAWFAAHDDGSYGKTEDK